LPSNSARDNYNPQASSNRVISLGLMSEFGSHEAAVGAGGLLVSPGGSPVPAGLHAGGRKRLTSRARLPAWLRLGGVAVLGAVATAIVAYEAAINPAAEPAHAAGLVRGLIIGTLIGAGIYAQTSQIQVRMGALLVAAGFYSSLWLLNGSKNGVAFSIGALLAGGAPIVFSYLVLVHPGGHLGTRAELRLLSVAGGVLSLSWLVLSLTNVAPPVRTPLMQCASGCPHSVFTVGTVGGAARTVLQVLVWTSWAALTVGAAWLAHRRTRSGPAPVRRSVVPVKWAAVAAALLWIAYGVAAVTDSSPRSAFGAAYVEMAIVLPLAILIGLAFERLFMGQALADFITGLARMPEVDPQPLMATALRDPSLKIGYRRQGRAACVDFSGQPVATEELGPARRVSWVRRGRLLVAAVVYDAEIDGQERFVQAAGAAALMRLERAQMEADLRASTADLAASRSRLVETADAERQRIERDLHDSIQQDLVALRIKMEMVGEAFQESPSSAEMMIGTVARQLDDVLEALRSVARGIYPSLLRERGIAEALKSVARRSPLAITVDARGVGRYREELEVAVYFCCLEALQNAIKHAGRAATVEIRLRERAEALEFQVRDDGAGFDPDEVCDRHGLLNMRDRADAVGGALEVTSREGRGTIVRGHAPLSPSRELTAG
jgi:signal transduction histidine kinase